MINLSLEFDISVSPRRDIPDIISAINFAHRHGVVVVAAAGNEERRAARLSGGGADGDLGRRDDARPLPGRLLERRREARPGRAGRRRRRGAAERPQLPPVPQPAADLPDDVSTQLADPAPIRTVRLSRASLRHLDGRARGVGDRGARDRQRRARPPSRRPTQILARLEQTATPLGGSQPNDDYGYGLLNAGAATAPLADARRATTPGAR